MVQIKIKGVNNAYHIYAEFDDFAMFLTSLKERLLRCSFQGERMFEAFFHLPNVNDRELADLFKLCEQTNTVINGINIKEEIAPSYKIMEGSLFNGQDYHFDEDVILLGNIPAQAYITTSASLFVMGLVRGTVDLMHMDCILCASKIDASVRICDTSYQNMTSFSPVKIYYDDCHLIMNTYEEERMWERQLQ